MTVAGAGQLAPCLSGCELAGGISNLDGKISRQSQKSGVVKNSRQDRGIGMPLPTCKGARDSLALDIRPCVQQSMRNLPLRRIALAGLHGK